MKKNLNIGDSALVFWNWKNDKGDTYSYFTCVKIVECKNLDGDNSEIIYIGKDINGNTYEGAYGHLLEGKNNYYYTDTDYMEILEKLKKDNNEAISKLEKRGQKIDEEISKTSLYIQVRKAEEKMLKCKHLFVKLKEGERYSGFHSSDYEQDPSLVECVHCGLTNRYLIEEDFYRNNRFLFSSAKLYYIYINNRIIRMKYNKGYSRCGKSFNDNVFHMISQEELKTSHPDKLYYMAKQINPEGKNKELFSIMKKIHYEIETSEERGGLTIIQMENIIERYKESTQVKKLTKQKNNN